MLGTHTIGGVELAGTLTAGALIPPIPPSLLEDSFHAVLGASLYPNILERERIVLFGEASVCRLFAVTPLGGEDLLATLPRYWSARRIPTIESGAIEQWRLEVASPLVTWSLLHNVATVLIISDTGERQRYRVLQAENAMKPGHVYHLRIEAIAQI